MYICLVNQSINQSIFLSVSLSVYVSIYILKLEGKNATISLQVNIDVTKFFIEDTFTVLPQLLVDYVTCYIYHAIMQSPVFLKDIKDIINPYNCLSKNENFSIKTTND